MKKKKYSHIRSKVFFVPEVHCRKLPMREGKVCGSPIRGGADKS